MASSRVVALALGELEPLPRARTPILLALHRPRIAREEARLLQRRAEVCVQLRQRPRDAVPYRARLAGESSAADVDDDVDLAELLDHLERLLQDHLAGLAAEVVVEGALVDGELARAGLEAHARDRFLAAAGCVDEQFLRSHLGFLTRRQLRRRWASG